MEWQRGRASESPDFSRGKQTVLGVVVVALNRPFTNICFVLPSIQVPSIPKTQLQILNLRPSYISFISGSVYLRTDDESQYSSSTDNPLPTICDSSSDGNEHEEEEHEKQEEEFQEGFDVYNENLHRYFRSPLPIIPEESPEASPPPASDKKSEREDVFVRSRAASQSTPPTFLQTDAGQSAPGPGSVAGPPNVTIELGEETTAEEDQDTELSLKPSHSHPSPTPKLCNDVTKSKDCSVPPNPGKRSATDAFITDSDSESQPGTKVPRTPTNKVGLAGSRARSDVHGGSLSVISKKATSTNEPESISQPAEPQLDNTHLATHPEQHEVTKNFDSQDKEKNNALQENQGSSDLTSTSVSENPSLGSLMANGTVAELDVEETLNTQSKVASDELIMFGSDDDDEKSAEINEYFSPIPAKTSGIIPSATTSTVGAAAQEALEVNDAGMGVKKVLESSEVTGDDLSTLYDPYEGTPTEVDEGSPSPTPMISAPDLPTSTSSGTIAQPMVENNPEMALDTEKVLDTPKPSTDDLPDTDEETSADEDSDDPGSPTPVISRITKPPTNQELADAEKPSTPHNTNAFSDVHELSEYVLNEPRVHHIDGGLFIVNPPNANSETYKIAITVSVKLQKGKLKGWNDLIVPGLPKLKTGESGYFIFQMLENCGMEFRTTGFRSNEFINDFLVAEFANSKDLVVPLRACNMGYYGIVRDFAVDQDIRSDYVVQSAQNKTNLTVTYNIVCSLKLPNHCFWAKTCSFFLYLDGGPDCNYRHEVCPSETGPPVIYLTPGAKPIGATRIQVICSPRDLELFCVVWKAKYSGKRISNWLPRIYPDSASSHGRERHSFRCIFPESEAETASCCQCAPVTPAGFLTGYFVLLASCLASLVMILGSFFLLFWMVSPNGLRNNNPDSNSMGFSGVSNVESPIEINQTQETKVSHYDWKLGAYEVVEIAREDHIESELPSVQDQPGGVETKEEGPELGIKSKFTGETQTLSWRDRVDYFLGWKGPLRQQVE